MFKLGSYDKIEENKLKRNGEGSPDPTAYKASKNYEEKMEERHAKTIHTIFHIAELAGFRIESRIILRDKRTGQVWE